MPLLPHRGIQQLVLFREQSPYFERALGIVPRNGIGIARAKHAVMPELFADHLADHFAGSNCNVNGHRHTSIAPANFEPVDGSRGWLFGDGLPLIWE